MARLVCDKIKLMLAVLAISCATVSCASGATKSSESCEYFAEREARMLRAAVDGVLPAAYVQSVIEEDGCDSANNGIWLSVRVSPSVPGKYVRSRFTEAGWTIDALAATDCAECVEGSEMAKVVNGRVIGMTLSPAGVAEFPPNGMSWIITVQPIDSCWDDDGYRCDRD
jgi:hypothetical protein